MIVAERSGREQRELSLRIETNTSNSKIVLWSFWRDAFRVDAVAMTPLGGNESNASAATPYIASAGFLTENHISITQNFNKDDKSAKL